MSGMTGEAMPVERRPGMSSLKETALNHENICLMVRLSPVLLLMPAKHGKYRARRQIASRLCFWKDGTLFPAQHAEARDVWFRMAFVRFALLKPCMHTTCQVH